MIDILQGLFNVFSEVINKLFNYEIPFSGTENIKLGYIFFAWIIIILLIYNIIKIFSIKGE